jgi:hypothetical protein
VNVVVNGPRRNVGVDAAVIIVREVVGIDVVLAECVVEDMGTSAIVVVPDILSLFLFSPFKFCDLSRLMIAALSKDGNSTLVNF